MNWLSQLEAYRPLWEPRLLLFVFVLSRISGLVMTAPILGAREAPLRVRALLAVTLSALVVPLSWDAAVETPHSIVQGLVLVAGEMMVGATLGLGMMILFGGLQVAGQLIGQMSGMSLGEVFNPELSEDVHAVSQWLFYVTMAVFVIIGGHRQIIAALLDTFAAMPPGTGAVPADTLDSLVTLLGESFSLGIRAAAPVATALLLATVVLGLVARTLPQLNALALGLPLNTIIAIAGLAISLGAIVAVFEEELDTVLTTVVSAWSGVRGQGSGVGD